jgi:hypothetical protein
MDGQCQCWPWPCALAGFAHRGWLDPISGDVIDNCNSHAYPPFAGLGRALLATLTSCLCSVHSLHGWCPCVSVLRALRWLVSARRRIGLVHALRASSGYSPDNDHYTQTEKPQFSWRDWPTCCCTIPIHQVHKPPTCSLGWRLHEITSLLRHAWAPSNCSHCW